MSGTQWGFDWCATRKPQICCFKEQMLKIIQAGNHLSINPSRKDKLISLKVSWLWCVQTVWVLFFFLLFHGDAEIIIWMSSPYGTIFRSWKEIDICVFALVGTIWHFCHPVISNSLQCYVLRAQLCGTNTQLLSAKVLLATRSWKDFLSN